MKRLAAVLITAAASSASCACCSQRAVVETPAVLVDPSDQTRAELSRVIGEALHRPPVLLAPDALTHESILIVEPVHPRDAQGLPLNGRDLGHPQRFELVKAGSRCVLIQQDSGRRWVLSQSCSSRVEPAAPG